MLVASVNTSDPFMLYSYFDAPSTASQLTVFPDTIGSGVSKATAISYSSSLLHSESSQVTPSPLAFTLMTRWPPLATSDKAS